MPSKTFNIGFREANSYELISPEEAEAEQIDPNVTAIRHSLEDDDGYYSESTLHRRVGVSRFLSHTTHDSPERREVVDLVQPSIFSFSYKFHRHKSLKIALELITQSAPSLLCAVIGSIATGVVFDQVQFWVAFTRIEELFILVPILLNLKGCLEMNLASRLSTSVRIDCLGL